MIISLLSWMGVRYYSPSYAFQEATVVDKKVETKLLFCDPRVK